MRRFLPLLLALFLVPHSHASDADIAKMALQQADMNVGVCAILGAENDVPLELAQASKMLVHVRDPRTDVVDSLLAQSHKQQLGIARLSASEGDLTHLPYATNTIDLLLCTNSTSETAKQLSTKEVLRVLRPRGMALVGGSKISREELETWSKNAKVEELDLFSKEGREWVQFRKPPLKGVDDWSHWEKSPDNNPVSTDQVIKAPYMTQFMAKPFYIGMPAVTTAAGGRTFLAIGHIAHHKREWNILNKLIARNGYNGSVLWQRDLPEGYLVHRSAFVATPETLYMIGGDLCVMLDTKTGKVKGTIEIPDVKGEWKWMAMQDDVLYILTGKEDPKVQTTKGDRSFGGWSWADLSKGYYGKNGIYNRSDIPWGFGQTLAAYNMKTKKVLWQHAEEKPIDSRSLAMVEDKMFFMCPGYHLRGLSSKDGSTKWTNSNPEVIELIAEPGKGLTSTPGFKTMCFTVATPKALIIQGQTKQNVAAISSETGKFLWKKKKVTNNPNPIFVDGKVILGVGQRGQHVVLDPVSGKELETLPFRKAQCTRLTASPDSFFCRGEGLMRFDREAKRMMIDGSARPACNDGAMPANGLLYLGPWQCDCNLSLIGNIARCSAGDFRFDIEAKEDDRLTRAKNFDKVQPLAMDEADWPTYRANHARSSGTPVKVDTSSRLLWNYAPASESVPTAPVAVGGLLFTAGEDGVVRALSGKDGTLRWQYPTAGPIKYPPTVAEGRAYFGSGDGYAYCVEAMTGRLLWRFRASPVERFIMLYGNLCSTWPVNSGVLVKDGIAYFAAGVVDHDGTYVYALDAKSGEIVWQNNTSGHLSKELRKGVSVQGNLTIQGNRLLLAGGNQVSPAAYDLNTGKCLAGPLTQGQPKANAGRFVGVIDEKYPVAGGRILYSAPENVATKGSFSVYNKNRRYTLNFGGIPPAWSDNAFAIVNFRYGKLTCCDNDKVAARIEKGVASIPGDRGGRFRANLSNLLQADGAIRWQTNLGDGNKFEAISLVVCPNAVVGVVRTQERFRSQPSWYLVAFNSKNGNPMYRQQLLSEPLPGGLLVDREGRAVVTTLEGRVLCFGDGE